MSEWAQREEWIAITAERDRLAARCEVLEKALKRIGYEWDTDPALWSIEALTGVARAALAQTEKE